jgi:predicted Zn-dependent protease
MNSNTALAPQAAPDTHTDTQSLVEQLRAMRPVTSVPQDTLDLTYAMAYHWLQAGEFDKARPAFEMLWRVCPDQAHFCAGLAQSALGQNEPDVAVSYFLLALGIDENNAGYTLGLGRAFLANKLPGHARLALHMAQAMGQVSDPVVAAQAGAALALMGHA